MDVLFARQQRHPLVELTGWEEKRLLEDSSFKETFRWGGSGKRSFGQKRCSRKSDGKQCGTTGGTRNNCLPTPSQKTAGKVEHLFFFFHLFG